jgi:hypothetical protein
LARGPACQGRQRTAYQRTVAALGTWSEVKAGSLPPPLHSAGLLPWRQLGRLAGQRSTRAQGPCRAPVRQEAHMAQALEAMGHEMQEQASEKRLGLHAHGLHLMARASMAIRAADAAVTDLPEARMGHRHAVGSAAQRVEHLGWPRARLCGIHHPRLALELVAEVGEACGRPARG